MWSDSQVVLHWIHNNPSKQGAFVTNRVRQIQAYKYPFRYCNTTENPADLPSRGRETADLGSSNLWWHGPAWLSSPEESWPEDIPKCNPSCIDVEHPENEAVAAIANAFVPEPPFSMTLSNYSSLNKLLRVTALCSRFVSKLRRQPADTGAITAEELAQAKIRWITHVQLVHYQPQFACLASGKPDRLTRQFGLFLENNIIKCHGRFQHSDIHCNDVILLPKNDHFTYLVIAAQHNLQYHQGVRHTLAEIRRSYWIPQGRQQVRSILKRCVICKRWQGAAYSLPKPAALPMERLTQGPPFSFTGCDFAGPLYTFDTKEPKKTYICLFTCAVTRALHLELVPDMTTASFILALKRFISRRGSPTVIISDNAKTFKLAQATINRIWHGVVISPDTVNFVASTGIEWKFNVERAPWWGGFFERMVGLVKRTIIKAIGRAKLSNDGMATVLAKVEAILNSRPLTYVHDEPTSGHALSPINFLSPASSFGLPTPDAILDPDYIDLQASATSLTKRIRQQQLLLDRFWNTWLTEYLSTVGEHHHNAKQSRNNPYLPHLGDVVVIKEDGLKRSEWKIAIIVHLFRNKDDGCVRAAQLRCNGKLIQRPIPRLYPLEVQATVTAEDTAPPSQRTRLIRKAAIKAKQNIKNIFLTDDDDI